MTYTKFPRNDLERAYSLFCSYRGISHTDRKYSRNLFEGFLGEELPINLGNSYYFYEAVDLRDEAISKVNMLLGPHGRTIVKAYEATRWQK